MADLRLSELGLFEPRAAAALGSSWLVEHEKVLEVAARLLLWAEAMPTIPTPLPLPPEPLPFLMKKAIAAALLLHSEASSSPMYSLTVGSYHHSPVYTLSIPRSN